MRSHETTFVATLGLCDEVVNTATVSDIEVASVSAAGSTPFATYSAAIGQPASVVESKPTGADEWSVNLVLSLPPNSCLVIDHPTAR